MSFRFKTSQKDAILAGAIFVIATILASIFDFNEHWLEFAHQHEHQLIELDEIPIALGLLAICLTWYGWRRIGELRQFSADLEIKIKENLRKEQYLEASRHHADARSRQMSVTSKMAAELLAANSPEEVSRIIKNYTSELFTGIDGAFFFTDYRGNNLRLHGQICEGKLCCDNAYVQIFSGLDCWAMRTAQIYDNAKAICDEPCGAHNANKLCFPMRGRSKTFGIVTLVTLTDWKSAVIQNSFNSVDELHDFMSFATDIMGMTLHGLSIRRQIKETADMDPLTGILNRRGFAPIAMREIKASISAKRFLAVIMFDLDNFKRLNDRYGHDVGDIALVSFTDLVNSYIRGRDSFARFGGEEFILMMPDTSEEQALKRINEIRADLEAHPLIIDGQQITMTVSAGIAILPTHGDALDPLVKQADIALYQAKALGRNRVELAIPSHR